jgi:hypothetical protein
MRSIAKRGRQGAVITHPRRATGTTATTALADICQPSHPQSGAQIDHKITTKDATAMVPNITFSQAIFSSGPRFELGVGAVFGTEFAADFVLASIIGLYLCSSIFPAEAAV